MVWCKRPRLTAVKSVRHGSDWVGSQPHGSIGQWPIVERCSKSIVTSMCSAVYLRNTGISLSTFVTKTAWVGGAFAVSRRGLTHVLNMETLDVGLRHRAARQRLALGEALGGGATPRVLGRQLPLPPPPPPRGLRPTVSCQRCCPQASMGAQGARCSMNTKGALRQSLSNLHPNTILKSNLDCNTHPQPSAYSVPFVNRPFESEIHGTVNFTYFCCVLLVTWCYRVLLSCYLRPK